MKIAPPPHPFLKKVTHALFPNNHLFLKIWLKAQTPLQKRGGVHTMYSFSSCFTSQKKQKVFIQIFDRSNKGSLSDPKEKIWKIKEVDLKTNTGMMEMNFHGKMKIQL